MDPENISKNNPIKAILFDMDGVLVNSMNYHLESWRTILDSFDIKVSDQFIFEHEGAMAPEVIKKLFNESGYHIDSNQITDIYLKQNTLFLNQYLAQVSLYPESIPLLKQLKAKGILLGLVSGSRRNLIEKIWTLEELAYFSTIISADTTERFKPHPEPYLTALTKLQQVARNCLVIENAPAGIQAASSAGITCFAISSTLPQEKLSGAKQVFPNLQLLTDFFNKTIF